MLSETARAKVNLFLHVTGKRPDGYHEIESAVVFTQDGDRLTAAPANTLSLSISGPFAAGLPNDESNLVMRAALALQQAYGVEEGAALHLEKKIAGRLGYWRWLR